MTQQGLRQATVRALTGRAETYDGDWMALFDQAGIPAGQFDGRMLRWINSVMDRDFASLPEAQQAFAEENGAYNWSSMGAFEVFNLDAFMASQSAGFWYNFLRNDTMFQEDVGPIPADEPNEVIGLALSQRLWGGQTRTGYLAGQPELVTNGDFAANIDGWQQAIGTIAWSAGALRATRSGGQTGRARQAITCQIGRSYRLTYSRPAGSVNGIVTVALADNTTAGAVYSASTSTGSYEAYFTATQTTHWLFLWTAGTTDGDFAEFDNVTIKEVSQVPATQSTTSFKVKYQLVGATGDGTDDREGTNYAAGSGENFLMLPATTVPVTLAGTQVLAGAMDGSANGAYIAITAGGALRVKWGSTTLDSTGVDLRNGAHDLGFWTDNGTLYLFADGVVVGSGAWTGTIPTTTWNLWALNNNGTASNFFAGSLTAALAGREAINLARAIQICANA